MNNTTIVIDNIDTTNGMFEVIKIFIPHDECLTEIIPVGIGYKS